MAKIIYLNTGEAVVVDDEDYPILSRYSWRKVSQKGYAGTTIQFADGTYRTLYLHQMILATNTQVDHDNRNIYDCQKSNLRKATYQQNGWNKPKTKRCRHGECTSKYKGVSAYTNAAGEKFYRVLIKLTKKGIKPDKFLRINGFKTEDEAAHVYDREIVKLRGKWAVTNLLKNKETQEV